MANTIIKAEQIVSGGLGVLEREIVLPALISSDASAYFQGGSPKNDTVSIRVPGRTTAKDYAWRDHSGTVQISDLTEHKISVTLDTHTYNAIQLTDEELTLDIRDFTEQVITPQVRSVAERLEDKIAAKIRGAAYGSNVVNQSGDFYEDLLDVRKLLNDNFVPQSDRVLIVGTNVERGILADDQFRKVDQSGSDSALREATIGRIAGFNVVVCNSIDEDEAFAYHKTAFQAVYRVPAAPIGGVDSASGSYAGIALRWLRDYDSAHLVNRSIFDTFFGVNVVTDPDDYTNPASTFSLKRAVKLAPVAGS